MTDQGKYGAQIGLYMDAAPDTGRVLAIWNRCDGTPGNPGVETIPSEDGPEKVACLGCPHCRPNGVRARIARTGDVLLGAGPSYDPDEVW
jgi:hypothetical protein